MSTSQVYPEATEEKAYILHYIAPINKTISNVVAATNS